MIMTLIVLVSLIGALFLASNWCIKDATRRGKSPTLVTVAVVLFFPLGLIAWLAFRPRLLTPIELIEINAAYSRKHNRLYNNE